MVIIGFGTIAVFASLDPSQVSPVDGRCRISRPLKASLPLLIYDHLINTRMTFVFVRLGFRYVRAQSWKQVMQYLLSALGYRKPAILRSQQEVLIFMMIKTVTVALTIIHPTVLNLALFFKLKGRKQGQLCFTICITDGKSFCFLGSWG